MNALAAIVFVFMLYASLRFVFRIAFEAARLVAVVVICAALLALCGPTRAEEPSGGAVRFACSDCAVATAGGEHTFCRCHEVNVATRQGHAALPNATPRRAPVSLRPEFEMLWSDDVTAIRGAIMAEAYVIETEKVPGWSPLSAPAIKEAACWLVRRVEPDCRHYTITVEKSRRRGGSTDCAGRIWLKLPSALRHRYAELLLTEVLAHEIGHHVDRPHRLLRSAVPELGEFGRGVSDSLFALQAEALAVPAAAHLAEAGLLPLSILDQLEQFIGWSEVRSTEAARMALGALGEKEVRAADPEHFAKLLYLVSGTAGARLLCARRATAKELAVARGRLRAMVCATCRSARPRPGSRDARALLVREAR